jgi:hypothetical protein
MANRTKCSPDTALRAASPETVDNRGTMVRVGRAQLVVAALAAAMAAAGCATHAPVPARAPSAGASAMPRAEAAAPPPARACGPTDRDYEAWFIRTFGVGYEVFHDGPDPTRLRDLQGEPKAEAERMLRRGLAACSTLAVSAIRDAGWRDLVPDLTRAVGFTGQSEFRARVIVALEALGSRIDFSDQLIAVLSSGSIEARTAAAMGARHFSLDRFRLPLLERVRQDPAWLVRYHAAESLFVLADIYPRELSGHPALMTAVACKSGREPSPLESLGFPPPLTAEARERLAAAADQLNAEVTARLAEGRCSKPVTPQTIELHIIPVVDAHLVTLTAEESIGSCERELAFVVFVESPEGFSRRGGAGAMGRDPLRVELATASKPVTVSYSRATHLLTVGTLTLDTARANVAVLSIGPKGVAVRYERELALGFEREQRTQPTIGIPLLDAQPEIIEEVRELLGQVPELRALVRGGPAARPGGD